jgi:hypothetical protein
MEKLGAGEVETHSKANSQEKGDDMAYISTSTFTERGHCI